MKEKVSKNTLNEKWNHDISKVVGCGSIGAEREKFIALNADFRREGYNYALTSGTYKNKSKINPKQAEGKE